MGKKLNEIPKDKLYVGMPVKDDIGRKGEIVHLDSSEAVPCLAVIKLEDGEFGWPHRAPHFGKYEFDSQRG